MKKCVLFLFCVAFIVICFLNVPGFIDAGRRGLTLFVFNVLPVLFPFFFISGLMVESKIFRLHTRAGIVPIWLFSVLSGFPTSAKILSELYEKGEISKKDAILTSTFTSTPSPIFVIATIGTILFSNTTLGIKIFIAIIIGALVNGMLYKCLIYRRIRTFFNKQISPPTEQIDIPDVISRALTSAIQGIFAVGGLIMIFFIIGSQLDLLMSLSPVLDTIISSTLEMTAGIFRASTYQNMFTPLGTILIPTAILAFGGICVGMQGFIFFKKFGMSFWFYLGYKATHTIFSVIAAIMLWLVF
ncbi:MAG: hypothetical protein FWE16_00870 [Firmicutes bacterium]|nr:hypothetical protein [Bacillota bacterium]